MLDVVTYVASTAKAVDEKADLFTSLGIDVPMLIFQMIAFLALLWLLSRFVFPVLIKSIDEREAKIAEGQRAASEAVKAAEQAQTHVEKELNEARKQAADIVATAKKESAEIIEKAEKKARAEAERLFADAKNDIDNEIAAAKTALHNETLELVAAATEKVLGRVVTPEVDKKLVAEALREAR